MKYPFIHIKNRGDNINGLLWLLYNQLGATEYFEQVKVKASSNYSDSVYDQKAIDFDQTTLWSSLQTDTNSWIYFELPFSWYLEGYTIQTCDHTYHPKSWYFSASNNGNQWTDETYAEDSENVMKNGQFKSVYVDQKFSQPYQFFKVRFGSSHYLNAPRFDIAQIEFFGKPIKKFTCIHKKSITYTLSYILLINILT